MKLVLDRVNIPPAATRSGFFYNVYLDLPATGDVDAVGQAHFVGTLGAFELASQQQGKNAIDFDVTDLLFRLGLSDLHGLVVSFVRVSGANAPKAMRYRSASCARN